MQQPPTYPCPDPTTEAARLQDLGAYQILDTDPEGEYTDIVQLVTSICDVPIALISLLDDSRQWFKARVGIEVEETPRSIAFCSHAILSDDLLIIEDATQDARFRDNPMVTGPPHIRFYAGAPLITPRGHRLGTLCAIDNKPRPLLPEQQRALKALARQVMQLLALREENLRKDRLNAILSHDLRSPFNGIIGFAELISSHAESLDREEIATYGQRIHQASKQALGLLENLLHWSRLQLDAAVPSPQRLEVAEAAAQAIRFLAELAASKQITLRHQIEPGSVVWADALMVDIILRNLLHNAVKFSPAGSEILVTAEPDDDYVALQVRDHGTGMSEEQIAGLFTVASQASRRGTAGEGGTGLGMPLCKSLAELQNGSLQIDSTPGIGTTIHLRLPLAE